MTMKPIPCGENALSHQELGVFAGRILRQVPWAKKIKAYNWQLAVYRDPPQITLTWSDENEDPYGMIWARDPASGNDLLGLHAGPGGSVSFSADGICEFHHGGPSAGKGG